MKRMFIILLVLLVLGMTACEGQGPAAGPPENASPYQLIISSSDLSPGTSRLVLTVWDGPERLKDARSLQVSLYTLSEEGESAERIWEGTATGYLMGEEQYWVVYPEFPAVGHYGVQAVIEAADGTRVENRALLGVKDAPDAPVVGQPAPRSETRTLHDAPVEELTSAGPYIEDFYRMSIAEAAESGNPSLVVFATPGHCSSRLCGPVMETVQEVADEAGETLNVVHVEIYRDFTKHELDPAVTEWNLPSEPWVFVLDEQGMISARLDGLVGAEELRQALQEVEGG
jgi:hypothetical protein